MSKKPQQMDEMEESVPVPSYRGMYRSDTLRVFVRGEMHEALEWLGRYAGQPGYRLVSILEGVPTEVARSL